MAHDLPRTGSGSASAGEKESLPRLTEVVPDFEELSPFYQRPSSAPPVGADPNRSYLDLERQYSDRPVSGHPQQNPLPPLRASTIRTHPGAGVRLPYHRPFEVTLDPQPTILNTAIERTQSELPPRRQSEVVTLSPTLPDPITRVFDTRHESLSTLYEPPYETQRRPSRGHLPPIELGTPVEGLREAPSAPHLPPLPPLRAAHVGPGRSYPVPSPRFDPYTTEHRPTHVHEQGPRRRYSHSQTLPRDYPRPQSPFQPPSPTLAGRPPSVYPPESYQLYSPYARDARGGRRTSIATSYYDERRPSRQETVRYPPPSPYGSAYPPPHAVEYSGGRYDPYHGALGYSPPRRLSQQEPGEQVTQLGVPEQYRQPISSPTSSRVQPPPLSQPSSATPGKRRGNLPKESKDKLKQWLSLHVDHPYPTEEEKKELAAEAGMTMGQINNWFINARRRTLPRIPGRSGSPSTSRTLRRRPGDS